MERSEELELEIAAFQAPHIKRARIVLAVAAVIYLYWGWDGYHTVATWRREIASATGPGVDQLASQINLAYAVVIGWIVGGIAMFVLAGIAGRLTMLAFYIAVGVFGAMSLLELYVSDGALLTSLVWWMIAIVLTLGFIAARKAHKLRATA